MPAIKLKKATQNYLAEKEREKEKEKEKELGKEKKAVQEVPEAPAKSAEEFVPKKEKPKFSLDTEILHEKRKRTIPPAEQRLIKWLDDNLQKKEGTCLAISGPKLYTFYTEECVFDSASVVDFPVFTKYIKEKLGNEFGLSEDSVLKGIIKEKKAGEVKAKPKVVAESLSYKMKDIIEEMIKEKGNPNRGVWFHVLQRTIGNKYPAIQVDVYPNRLLKPLDRGVRFGHIILVRGIGKTGFYRLPGESTAEEDIKAEEKKEQMKKEKEERKKKAETEEGAIENGEEKSEEEGEEKKEEEEEEEGKKDKGKKKAGKRKHKEEDKEKEGTETEEQAGEEPKKKKKKKKSSKKRDRDDRRWGGELTLHSEPKRIEDTFEMAFTYMSMPKEASASKIRKYVSDHYPSKSMDRVKHVLESGCDKNLWQQVTGATATQGSFRLLMEDFNPGETDNMEDIICQAIVATHEPKQAALKQIKKYIMQYHPDFLDEGGLKQHRFRSAIEKAVRKNKLRQITGIGLSGTFRLMRPFVPSPAVLAGDAEGELEEKDNFDVDDEDDYAIEEKYKESYVVRKTKSGRMAGIDRFSSASNTGAMQHGARSKKSSRKRPVVKKRSGAKKSYREVESDDESDEDSPPKASQRKKGGKRSSSKTSSKRSASKRSYQEVASDEDEVSEDENDDDSPPKASQQKKGGKRSSSKTPKRSATKTSYREVESDEDDDVDDDVSPPPRRGADKKSSKKSASKKLAYKKQKHDSEDDEELEAEEYQTTKSGRKSGITTSIESPSPVSPKKKKRRH